MGHAVCTGPRSAPRPGLRPALGGRGRHQGDLQHLVDVVDQLAPSSPRGRSWACRPGPSRSRAGRIDGRDADAVGGQQLLLHAADRQHLAAQRDLAGHGHVAAHRHLGERRDEGRGHRDAGRRAVLGDGALGHVDVDVEPAVEVLRRCRTPRRASARSDIAACADSCITSPSLPVSVSAPLPGISVTSIGRISPPDLGPGQAGGDADLVLLLLPRGAEARDAQVLGEVLGA